MSFVSHRFFLQYKFVLPRGLVACTRRDGVMYKGNLRAYSRFKSEYYPEDPMAFVTGLSDFERQKLKDCLQNYSMENENVEHVEKPSNRKLRLGRRKTKLATCNKVFRGNVRLNVRLNVSLNLPRSNSVTSNTFYYQL